MVVGAGRGPLIRATLNAAAATGRRVRVWAVEKNVNAVVHLWALVAAEGCAPPFEKKYKTKSKAKPSPSAVLQLLLLLMLLLMVSERRCVPAGGGCCWVAARILPLSTGRLLCICPSQSVLTFCMSMQTASARCFSSTNKARKAHKPQVGGPRHDRARGHARVAGAGGGGHPGVGAAGQLGRQRAVARVPGRRAALPEARRPLHPGRLHQPAAADRRLPRVVRRQGAASTGWKTNWTSGQESVPTEDSICLPLMPDVRSPFEEIHSCWLKTCGAIGDPISVSIYSWSTGV